MDEKKYELNDDALDAVSGGTGSSTINTCSNFMCVWCGCGKAAGSTGHYCEAQGGSKDPASWFDYTCEWCEHLNTCTYRK